MKHQDDCVYPQTELRPLCTCPRVNPKPLPQVIYPHDPLCPAIVPASHRLFYRTSVKWFKEHKCQCDLINQVRAQYDDY